MKRFMLNMLVTLVVMLGANSPAFSASAACPNGEIFGSGMITHVCWTCLLPVRIMGISIGSGSSQVPDEANDSHNPICLCKDNLGVYQPGLPYGSWEPARLVEAVRVPYCSPVLMGTKLQTDLKRIGKPGGFVREPDTESAFYHYHYFAYPLLIMLDLFTGSTCNPDGYNDLDIMYMSELDPTWNDDELSFFTSPESAIFANPIAQAACAADAAKTAAGKQPIKSLFWCAGSWGGMYPMTGKVPWGWSPPLSTSLVTARALSALHRRGLARKTMGEDNMCDNSIEPTLPKTQYKFEQLYPLPEANGNHWIGQTPHEWGEWRNIPEAGEDFINLIWRWNDCCASF